MTSQVPKASAIKFLNPFGNPTNTALLTQSQIPPYPDQGVLYAGYSKIQTPSGYTLKRQNIAQTNLQSFGAGGAALNIQAIRPNAQLKNFYCTSVAISCAGVAAPPAGIYISDSNGIAFGNIQFQYVNMVANTPLNIVFDFSRRPLQFLGSHIHYTTSQGLDLYVILYGFEEDK
jgi:hypothetical protein